MLKCLNVKMNKGFTLMEAIVAIFVITTGLVGVLSLVSQTISASTFSKDKLIAAYLAQEGIEIIRNIRDTNWVNNNSWTNNISLNTSSYQLDYQSSQFPDPLCSLGPGNYLKYDGNFYNCSSGNDTKFTRKITITDFGNYINVLVSVQWQEKGVQHKVEAQENLYNWYK
jgi:Tfp pilus assembly protein PilV